MGGLNPHGEACQLTGQPCYPVLELSSEVSAALGPAWKSSCCFHILDRMSCGPGSVISEKFPGSRIFRDRAYLLGLEALSNSLLSTLLASLTPQRDCGAGICSAPEAERPTLLEGSCSLSSRVVHFSTLLVPWLKEPRRHGVSSVQYRAPFQLSAHCSLCGRNASSSHKACPLCSLTLLCMRIHLARHRKDNLKITSVSLPLLGPPTRTWPSLE